MINSPAVSDAIVVGVPDSQWGEAVIATVAPAPNQHPGETELTDFVRAQLADYKVPKAIFFQPQLARHPNGKPDFNAAREYAVHCLAERARRER